jgi:hypothetical protein
MTNHPEGDTMSTLTNQQTAAATPSAAASTEQNGRRSVPPLVFGTLCLLLALALLGGAVAGIVGLENNRDATGYFVTHTHHYQTSSYALSTESLNVGSVTGALEASLLRLRITATSSHSAKPLFIGIARTEDVARYLARVQHDELRNINFDPFKVDFRRIGTGAPAALPSTKSFWQTHASGTGTQTISWPVESGQWSAVVMNADGSRNVNVNAQLAARLSGAWWFVAAFIALGVVSLLGGIALIQSGMRKQAPETTSATQEA